MLAVCGLPRYFLALKDVRCDLADMVPFLALWVIVSCMVIF